MSYTHNKYVDGSRKRRHSTDIAKSAYYAQYRQARFARRFGVASHKRAPESPCEAGFIRLIPRSH